MHLTFMALDPNVKNVSQREIDSYKSRIEVYRGQPSCDHTMAITTHTRARRAGCLRPRARTRSSHPPTLSTSYAASRASTRPGADTSRSNGRRSDLVGVMVAFDVVVGVWPRDLVRLRFTLSTSLSTSLGVIVDTDLSLPSRSIIMWLMVNGIPFPLCGPLAVHDHPWLHAVWMFVFVPMGRLCYTLLCVCAPSLTRYHSACASLQAASTPKHYAGYNLDNWHGLGESYIPHLDYIQFLRGESVPLQRRYQRQGLGGYLLAAVSGVRGCVKLDCCCALPLVYAMWASSWSSRFVRGGVAVICMRGVGRWTWDVFVCLTLGCRGWRKRKRSYVLM